MALFRCLECEEKVSSDAEACPSCGASVPEMVSRVVHRRRPGKKGNGPSNPAGKKPGGMGLFLSVALAATVVLTIWALTLPETDRPAGTGYVDTSGLPDHDSRPKTTIESQFSAWDGSHRSLSRKIKDALNDPGSYEHVETRYAYLEDNEQLRIFARFRATNAFGVLILQNVTASASASGDGSDVTILSWE